MKRNLFLLPWNPYHRSLAWTLTEIFASSIIRLIPRRGDKHNNWSGDFLNRLLTNYFDDVENHQLMNVDKSCWKTWKFNYLSFVISSNVLVGDKILIHIKKLKKYRILWQGHALIPDKIKLELQSIGTSSWVRNLFSLVQNKYPDWELGIGTWDRC